MACYFVFYFTRTVWKVITNGTKRPSKEGPLSKKWTWGFRTGRICSQKIPYRLQTVLVFVWILLSIIMGQPGVKKKSEKTAGKVYFLRTNSNCPESQSPLFAQGPSKPPRHPVHLFIY